MNDLFPPPPPTLAEMISEVERELVLRRRNYPRWVAKQVMSKAAAERQLHRMEAVLEWLRAHT